MKAGYKLNKVLFKLREGDKSSNSNECATGGKWIEKTTDDFFKGKRVVLFSLPGAFTPTCSSQQLPGFENNCERFKKLGIDEVYCCSVNDAYTMNAWSEKMQIKNVKLIPDGNGNFTKQMGMLISKDHLGFGHRSWRYMAIITDGIVEKWWEEPGINNDGSDDDPYGETMPEKCLDEKQLKDYVSRCKDGGVKQVLVIGGGREPMGKFDSSFQLLETGYFEKMTIGIAGHPEGSPDISDSNLEKAMIDKKPYADYIVTQWLLDPQPIIDFISKQSIPVHVGITGPLKISSLIKFANIVGAKNSLNFLKSNFSKALDLLKPKDPNDLIGKVKSHTDFFHIYTFGGLKETNKWLKENGYV